MFFKKRKSLITLLVAIFAALFLCVGITLLTPETQSAQALTEPTCEFRKEWKYSFSGYSDLTEIDFVKTAPEGYSDSGKTLYSEIKIYAKDGDDTKIAFVYDGIITAPSSCMQLFSSLKKLTAIKFDNFTTSAVTDMCNMFYGCTSLTSITFGKNFITSAVKDMTSMFSNCEKLLSLDLSGFDISNVTTMRQMFLWCKSLTTLDLSNFDTSVNPTGNVDLAGMFSHCQKLENLILSDKFVSSKVSNIGSLFSGCVSLTSNDLSKIDLSKFDLTNVTNIGSMFQSCTELASVTFPAEFDTTKVNDMNMLFNGCKALTSVDLSNLNTANVANMSSMFTGCSALSSITFGDNFNTAKVQYFSSMFSGCSALTELDLSNFTAKNTDLEIGYMFSSCTKLAKLSVSESLAQKIAKEENGYSKSQLYNVCAKWYDSDGAEYTSENAFTASGTYFTTMPKYVVTCNNGSEFYETLEDAWTVANEATDATIKMNVGAVVGATLKVDSGNEITLDLKGNEITYTGDGGLVIIVGGTFKLEDNGTGTHTITSPVTNEEVTIIGGLITGGKGTLGGAMFVSDGGTFTMEGGTLAGNTAIRGCGGAVCCAGTFNFNGGSISHNKSGYGGGVCVYVDNANFVMGNGEISHNEATENGGGVYNNGTFNVSGAPKIADNKVSGNANNIVVDDNGKITVKGELTEGALIGISGVGEVADGFIQTTGKISDFFIPDNPEIVCVYVSDKAVGTVNFSNAHNGGVATCTQKAVCEMCEEEYGEIDGNAHTFDKLVIVSATATYSAFDLFDAQTAEVYTHCLSCNQNIEKLAASDLTVTYNNGNCLHADDTHVSLSANVGGQTLFSEDYSINVSKREATLVWEYTTSTVSEENAWVWNEIEEGSHFTYDGTSKSYRVRVRFTGADNDPDKDKYYYRAVDGILLVDGGVKAIENAAIYALALDGSKFADYLFTDNSASIEVKKYEITLSDAEVYRWTLGADKGSLLRDAYVEESNGTVLYYDPETGAAEGRTYVTRSVVRYRGDDTGLNIVLNGGEIADLFAGTGKRSNIAYSGTTAVGAVGKYTAIATLTLNDTLNYRYAGEITVADSRGMTIVISENGTKAVITKEWYVATINNGLLMPDGGEYSVNGWTFGEDIAIAVPKLEHGDENFNASDIDESDKRVSFNLYTDVDRTEQIGETFYRYDFADYINKSMPSGNYVLRVSVAEVNDAEGLAYQAFTRTFTFTVQKGKLEVADTLNGETFEHVYNGNVQLFDSEYKPTVSLKYVSASDRIGIWKNSGYDMLYGASYMTFHLARWQAEGGEGYEFVSLTQLENTLDRKQAPREVDTYTVQYKISALNYADYGGSTSFTVTITKQTVALPQSVTETLIKEYVYQIPQNALYYIEGNAKFTQAGTHTVTLKLADAENYAWQAGENVDGDVATVTVTLIMHDHVYGEWKVDLEPTCTEAGGRSKKCSLCDYIAEEEVAALGHDLTRHEAKAATCTENGWSAYETCARCDHTTYTEIAALGHDLTQHEAKAATCTENGWSAYETCARCDHTTYAEIAALGHDLTQHETKAATCTENGWSAYETCARCDHTTYAEIAALGHDYASEFTVDKQSTCTEKGSKSKHCSRCGEKTEITEIDITAHNLTHVEYKEATEDAAGNIEYWACADCAEYFSDGSGETVITDKSSVEIPMLIKENNVGDGLSAGAVVGIIIACVIVALVAVYAAGYFFLYRKNILLKGKVFDAVYVPMNAIFKKKNEE